MKSVTIMIAMAGFVAATVPATVPAMAHVTGSEAVPSGKVLVSDTPVAAPDRLPHASFVADNRQLSGSSYFYAPGMGPRCEIRMKRIQGRIYQACE